MTSSDNNKHSDYLTKDEIRELRKTNDFKAASMLLFNWLVIASCFAVFLYSQSIALSVLALFVLAGRQLGIAILMHECSHRSFFSTPERNQFFGHWFAGIPMLVPLDFYRPYHMTHHSKTGTEDDPDLKNIEQYPVTKTSFARKVFRDFTGMSGIKMLYGLVAYVLPGRTGDSVSMGMTASRTKRNGRALAIKNFSHAIVFHALFAGLFWFIGEPSLYLYWWISFVFFYPFILRMRQIAEHGAMPTFASNDVRDTTRTTLASWWERALFAPNYVNYHCEHHYLPTVPSYHLSEMHRLLVARGFYKDKPAALIERGGYLMMARVASSA